MKSDFFFFFTIYDIYLHSWRGELDTTLCDKVFQ